MVGEQKKTKTQFSATGSDAFSFPGTQQDKGVKRQKVRVSPPNHLKRVCELCVYIFKVSPTL
jgi:hypothetical protein